MLMEDDDTLAYDNGCPECDELREISRKLYEALEDILESYVADMEHGVKCLSEKAADDFIRNCPNMIKSFAVVNEAIAEYEARK
jgi:hypothetical protein